MKVTPLPSETEADFASWVLDVARLYGYMVAHFRPARTSHGWRTPVQGDGAGFPDMVLANPERGRVFAVELKRDKGKTSEAQDRWLAAFTACGVTAEVWRPAMRDQIVAMLRDCVVRDTGEEEA